MENIISNVQLVKFSDKSLPVILKSSHDVSTPTGDDEIMFLSSVDPRAVIEDGSCYSFNTKQFMCFCLYFIIADQSYAIVISSHYLLAHFFECFFRIVFNEFQKDLSSCNTAYGRYLYVLSILNLIPNKINDSIIVTFPFGETKFEISHSCLTLQDYDPTIYFEPNHIQLIWESLITGTPIQFIVNDIVMATNVVFSCLSLIAPLRYCDEMCMWLTETDPRFISIINEKSNLKIVATTSRYLAEATKHFETVIIVSDRKKTPNLELRKSIYNRTKKMLILMNYFFSNMIRVKDPYFDLLDKDVKEEEIIELLDFYKNQNIPRTEVFMKMIKTETFKKWRNNRNSREIFRDGVLGFEYKKLFNWRTKNDLEILQKKIPTLLKEYSGDPHICSVLKLHKQEIEKQLTLNN